MTAADIARALGGKPDRSGSFICHCPVPDHGSGRGDKRPSLSVTDGDKALLVHCFGGCDPRAVLDELKGRGLIEGRSTARPTPIGAARPAAATVGDADSARRTAMAFRLFGEAVPPAETPVERYLKKRGLTLPPEAAGEAIRWHPACPFGMGIITGCMVALVCDISTDAPLAIHRTALTRDGRKAEHHAKSRMILGPAGHGAVKLIPDAGVETVLGIGEGIESTLSLRQVTGCGALPVWALWSASQLAQFPVLAGVESLWVAVDHDAVGIAAAEKVRARWNAAGRQVVTARARTASKDLNDIIRRRYG